MLHQKIKGEIKKAMLGKNPLRLNVIRGLVAAFTNELVVKRRKPNETLADEETLVVIRREAKKRQDSIEQFAAGGRPDLVDQETAELEILKTYLPPSMTEVEIEKLAREKIAAGGVNTKQDIGKVIGALMKELSGRAKGEIVKTIVEKLLT